MSNQESPTGSVHEGLSKVISAELGSFVQSKSATFACGGSVSVKDTTATEVGDDGEGLSCPPITIRWDSPADNDGSVNVNKITFPVDDSEFGYAELAKLAEDCEPASFGYKGQDILDDTYRKAIKMDRSVFSSDFCPYELGIIDTIAQVLLPNSGGMVSTKGVRAELYKLNIYSAPSGFFKSHVDTPRSESQFGSLVISLPCRHEGGQLVVRHAAHITTFDWSAPKADADKVPKIQWAAFYSDCEHEVLALTVGHRITLTYNLYYALGVGDLAKNSPAMDPQSLPLYQKVEDALANPEFMPNGGHLGVFLTHGYAHSTKEGRDALPAVLKGADMAVYSVFRAHGLNVQVRTVLHDTEMAECYEAEFPEKGKYVPFGRIGSLEDELVHTSAGGYCGYDWEMILEEYPHEVIKGIYWLMLPEEPGPDSELGDWSHAHEGRGVGFLHMFYGNEAEIDVMYTYAALLIEVPPAAGRPQVKVVVDDVYGGSPVDGQSDIGEETDAEDHLALVESFQC